MTDPATDDALILTEVHDRSVTITLNRPQARNALSTALIKAMRGAVRDAQADDAIDVIILTGADPAFCAGLDLKELGSGGGLASGSSGGDDGAAGTEGAEAGTATGGTDAGAGTEGAEGGTAAGGAQSDMGAGRGPLPPGRKPVIGAINGAAITGGFELALACDFLVASERARFADTHARVGIQPWWGLSVLLPQAIGIRRAREMSGTGNFCDAQTALAWGLVNHVVPHDELLPFTRGLAADIASNDARAVRQLYATYAAGSLTTAGDAWEIESRNAAAWQGQGLDADEIERRRQGIVDRGRGQLG